MRPPRILLAAALFAACAAFLPARPASAQPAEGDGTLFVNLTSADAWRAGMALSFARNAQGQGHEVVVFLNVEAVRLAAEGLPQPAHLVSGEPLQGMLQAAMADGATVIVCPMCLEVAGIGRDELIDGVTLGGPGVTLPALFGETVRVMSY
jgi:predicted peroxiredoxin